MKKTVMIDNSSITSAIFGSFDCNVRLLEERFGVRVYNSADPNGTGDAITIEGDADNVELCASAIAYLKRAAKLGEEIDESELSEDFTIGELWRFVRDKEENAQE